MLSLAGMCALAALVCGQAAESESAPVTEAAETRSVQHDLGGSLKSSSLVSHNPRDRLLFPDEWTGAQLLRLRLNWNLELSESARADFAYEHRAQYFTSEGGGGGGVLPSFGDAAYRLWQLDWQIAEDGGQFFYRHEIDRASLTLEPSWGRIVIGRQGIGLGRGVLFSAVDLFAPFTPAEVDREWRRGIDALRIETNLSSTSSAELIAAAGRSWDDSALLGRVRGYVGDIDGEILLGKRGEDLFAAAVTSGIMGGAEVHAELALFNTPEDHPDGGLFGNDHLIGKAVIGSSYTFDIGNGLYVLGEYHYNGFGVEDTDDVNRRFRDPAFSERLLRGDFQTLGQHALGLQTSYVINETFSVGALLLSNPTDGSGLLSPMLNWDISDNSSMTFSVFLPWGAEPERGRIRSEYGTSPASFFVQFSTHF